jgi:hypothetical protein
MNEVISCRSGNRTATVYHNEGSLTGNHYVVELKIDGKLFQKQQAFSLGSAENLAEEFVNIAPDTGGVRLLNENGQG